VPVQVRPDGLAQLVDERGLPPVGECSQLLD
jgi:hypothetical protein